MMHLINKTLLTLVSALLLVSHAHSDTITIRSDVWFPMNGEPGSAQPGYMIELAQTILSKHGHTVDYRLMPWERALNEVRLGTEDCVVGAYKEDAPDFIFPEEHWGMDNSAFYIKKGGPWRYTGLDSLDTIKLGVIGGYAYGDEFDEYVKQNKHDNIQTVKGDNALEKNIKKVIAGRLTTFIDSPLVVAAKLKEMGMEGNIDEAGTLGDPSPMYIACSPVKPNSKDYIKLIDDGTKALRASGELDAIMAKYGLKDWK
ncbi:substrate-binding periplasmic protein [Litoribrevibacter euphylliae]|uniref:Substrate-binding periplasmic protein n=1 Tax=Litoribrevibacter euphylliae TaxID=1834034 RepID=A0ABV7H9J1_9GAMM